MQNDCYTETWDQSCHSPKPCCGQIDHCVYCACCCVPGPVGAAGAAGPTGPAGQISTFADFYALMPPDNASTVAPGTDVSFLQDGPNGGNGITRTGQSSFNLAQIGSYQILFQVSVGEAGQLLLTINGADLAYTVAGRVTGTSQIRDGDCHNDVGQLRFDREKSSGQCNGAYHHAACRRDQSDVCAPYHHASRIIARTFSSENICRSPYCLG